MDSSYVLRFLVLLRGVSEWGHIERGTRILSIIPSIETGIDIPASGRRDANPYSGCSEHRRWALCSPPTRKLA